ncbi:MAG: DUF4382 domain-containing protein [Cyclobacteriaceae bacterium]
MKKIFLVLLALIPLGFFSCEDEKNARIEVWLTDAPGEFQEVNIDVQGVEIHSNETDHEKGWQIVEVNPAIYNLQDLTNGREILLGDLDLPGGRISQIRLKLGDNNTVKVDDVVYPLSTPSAQQSGLKLQIHEIIAEGITYKILLDFEAGKSVIKTGSDAYSLKPVIRAVMEAKDGGIKGVVEPAAVVAIAVMKGEEIITTTSSDEEGNFLIRGLDAGTYTLVFDAEGDQPVVERTNVTVETGVVTDVGVVDVPE